MMVHAARITPLLTLALVVMVFSVAAQVTSGDSVETLETVEVKAYDLKRQIGALASPVIVISGKQLNRFGNNSLVPVFNTQPGIRLEERSPGSYRMNIRGSSLRAPFGVRNVKIYYNGIPYTTPGGDSYFNHIGFATITSLEIIKGPGSSMYGAGTGGVLLMESLPPTWKEGASAMLSGGNFGSFNYALQASAGNDSFRNALGFQDQRSNGYRDHTALQRKVFNWDLSLRTGSKSRLDGHFLYGDLQYETPGALNRKEFDSLPRLARPRTGTIPGAVEAKASMRQRTFLSGFTYQYRINDHWSDQTTLYGAYSQLRNPGIFNYSWVNEAHAGGRTVMRYRTDVFTFHTGMEVQQGFTTAKALKNLRGVPDSLRTDDEINNLLLIGFMQGSIVLPHQWIMDAGISINRLTTSVTRLSVLPVSSLQKTYRNEWAPRVALLKKINTAISVYASLAKGFSPPTTSELLPSSGIIASSLEAEKGINLEAGTRGALFNNRLRFDISLFDFNLKQAIVVRRDAIGRDYFVNAGATRQRGMEAGITYRLGAEKGKITPRSMGWLSYTGYAFQYKNYARGLIDYSGKRMPSVPRHTLVAGVDMYHPAGWYAHATYTYTDAIPLNDANTDWADAFHLISTRTGWKKQMTKQWEVDFFLSIDNITDTSYCLGFDLNANGGRYFNPASGRSWTTGLRITCIR